MKKPTARPVFRAQTKRLFAHRYGTNNVNCPNKKKRKGVMLLSPKPRNPFKTVLFRKARLSYTCTPTLAFRKKYLASLHSAQPEDFVFRLKTRPGGFF